MDGSWQPQATGATGWGRHRLAMHSAIGLVFGHQAERESLRTKRVCSALLYRQRPVMCITHTLSLSEESKGLHKTSRSPV